MSLIEKINNVLLTPCPISKAVSVLEIYDAFKSGDYSFDSDNNHHIQPPDMPALPDKPILCAFDQVPDRPKGEKGKFVLLHAITHIELNAINLACDMIVRFYGDDRLPKEFFEDWLKVAWDEARHFRLLNDYLNRHNIHYGDYISHDGLWTAAYDTRNDLGARLAIVPMVLEARGLDVTPRMIKEFSNYKDSEVVEILNIIYNDEITHVHTGVKWFEFVTNKPISEAETLFHSYLRRYYKGKLQPPFNKPARDQAEIPRPFYENYR